ncbi:hypothetical protein F5887DRAFT_1271775 [Amanita rubescens]|nr:hypothetical protein F5887DRAFT_1271775 [Amanita rubescens]
MVPLSQKRGNAHPSRLLNTLVNVVSYYVPCLLPSNPRALSQPTGNVLVRRGSGPAGVRNIIFPILIPVLVLLSGLFAGLTLGYMSLDETQLNVLSISGTPDQRKYANKIKPIRKNGHLLLVTLLLANMIVNETLPVISSPVLGGGVQSVVVSTVLIVIFSEIIPQSLFTRHGLYLGAKMAGFTQCLIYALGIIAWPVAKLLEFVLGSHHGIIYRRAELKELIAMHSAHAAHGGDLKMDTVAIIGATLDLQEKVVKQAMTPIEDVFMLSIDSRLDYDLMKKICETGHSRVPVYEEIDIPGYSSSTEGGERTQRVKRILGILLVKNCVMLDPKDATPLRKIPLNIVPFVPNNESLLHILDRFQEGRSHMAIVSRFSMEKAASVKEVVKRGLTQRLLGKVGIGDSDDSRSDSSEEDSTGNGADGVRLRTKYRFRKKRGSKGKSNEDASSEDGETTLRDREGIFDKASALEAGSLTPADDIMKDVTSERTDKGVMLTAQIEGSSNAGVECNTDRKRAGLNLPLKTMTGIGMISLPQLEQNMPADAVLSKAGAAQFLKNFDPAVMPLGIITLEDVLEELIGEEIYDEFDVQGARGDPYELPHLHVPARPEDQSKVPNAYDSANSELQTSLGPDGSLPVTSGRMSLGGLQIPKPLKGFDIFALRSHSAPPVPGDGDARINCNHLGKEIAQVPVKSNAALSEDNVNFKVDDVLPTPQKVVLHLAGKTRSRPPSRAELTGQDGPMSCNNAENATVTTTNETVKTISPSAVTFGTSAHATPLYAPTPASSLEAILLDRKRRIHSYGSTPVQGTTGSTSGITTRARLPDPTLSMALSSTTGNSVVPTIPRPSSAPGSKAKGTRFKSSRLGSTDLMRTSELPMEESRDRFAAE